MDVISMHQAGFTGAVASLGTSLTEDQCRLLSSYTPEVVLAYDADEAGERPPKERPVFG
jgi:DNA primase